MEIYRRLRPGDPPTLETAQNLFNNLFFNPERYDLSKVGRLKLNYKFKLDEPLDNTVLTKRDILETVRYLIELKNGSGVDRRHRPPRQPPRARGRRADGEPVPHRSGPHGARDQGAHEHVSGDRDAHAARPHQRQAGLGGGQGVLRVSSQLSQFMDQTNPLSEVTHKRRLSALGPGGLTRERAGFEVRDVHPTHYGRICPIETPEGPNIGLIASLSTYARVNEYGFIETPYRKVEGGSVTEEVEFYSALAGGGALHRPGQRRDRQEGQVHATTSSRAATTASSSWPSRRRSTLMDVSPNQLVSVAASLIPFLENDDANRALMGSNMQRQAVPLHPHRVAAGRHRHGGHRGARLGRHRGRQARRRRRVGRRHPHRRAPDAGERGRSAVGQARHLQPDQVPALEPEHLHQPEADRRSRATT